MRALAELQKLTPEDRAKIWKALMAVMNLPEDQRAKLINTEEERRAKFREEIDKTLKEIGVTIPDDKKRKFFRSFFEGRRRIEETLRKEGDERRAALLQELNAKLKQDFGAGAVEVENKVAPSGEPPAVPK